jgi:hypothetical protein
MKMACRFSLDPSRAGQALDAEDDFRWGKSNMCLLFPCDGVLPRDKSEISARQVKIGKVTVHQSKGRDYVRRNVY